MRRVTRKSLINFACGKCEVSIGEAVEHEVKLGDEDEAVIEFTYLGDRVCDGRGCVADVAARTSCGWIELGECGESLYGKRFPLRQKGAANESYVRSTMLHGSEAWSPRER